MVMSGVRPCYVTFKDRQLEIKVPGPDGRGETRYTVENPIYVNKDRQTEIAEHEKRKQLEALDEEIARKKEVLTKLNQAIAPRFYVPKISIDMERHARRCHDEFHKASNARQSDVLPVSAYCTHQLVDEIDALRGYVAWLEAENGHVQENEELTKRMYKMEDLLSELYRMSYAPVYNRRDITERLKRFYNEEGMDPSVKTNSERLQAASRLASQARANMNLAEAYSKGRTEDVDE